MYDAHTPRSPGVDKTFWPRTSLDADPVIVLDENRRAIDINPETARVWADSETRIGDAFADVFPELAAEISIPPPDDDGSRVTLDIDDDERHYSITVSNVDRGHGGDGNWHSVLLRDVTELERQRERLQTQNARLDQVASTISHDLRNPINVVSGRLELMEVHAENGTVEETEHVSLDDLASDAWDHVDTKGATLGVTGDYSFEADRSKTLTIFEYGFTTTDEGTGLGLSIVKTMAESHGWTVEHDDEHDDGTRFAFESVGTESTAERTENAYGPS